MSNVKSKTSHRLLAALMSFVMVLSILPFSMMAMATDVEAPELLTVSVADKEGNAVEGAIVALAKTNDALDFAYRTVKTDANGVAGFSMEEIKTALTGANLTEGIFNVVVTKEGYNIKNQFVAVTVEDSAKNVNVVLTQQTDNMMSDLVIKGNELTYNGEAQELVSITCREGDIIEYYFNDFINPVTKAPTATDVGTYTVGVLVIREGEKPFSTTVTASIVPADIDDISIEGKVIEYDESLHTVVVLNGSFEENDVVVWTVDGVEYQTKEIPQVVAVGEYNVTLTVDRGSNYNKLITEAVKSEVIYGELDLEGLEIKGLEGIYTVDQETGLAEEQLSLTVENQGNYDLKYQIDDGDMTIDENAWVDEIPVISEAGLYIVWVKAVKESYNEKVVAPYNVYIEKAPQQLQFDEAAPSEIVLGENNEYNSQAYGVNYSGNDVVYSLVDATAEGIATITADGKLTAEKAGIVTVKAVRPGNNNYLDAVVYKTVVIKDESDELVAFDADSLEYILDANAIVSEKAATAVNDNDNGVLTYTINNADVGLYIDPFTGKITVEDVVKLTKAMGNSGVVEIIVEVAKAEGSLDGIEWVCDETDGWVANNINKIVFAGDTDTYTVKVSFAAAPEFDAACSIKAPDAVSGWYNLKNPAEISVLDSSKYMIALDEVNWDAFKDVVTIEEQGTETHYIYLMDMATKQICAGIAVDVKVDTVVPGNLNIEFSEPTWLEKVGMGLGFYNPTVTITFTAEDTNSGIDHFDWTYTPENGEPVTQEIEVTVEGNKATATLTLPAEEAEQLHGKISFTATDKALNEIGKEDGYVFIVDTISPEVSVEFKGEAADKVQDGKYNGAYFFKNDVTVEITVTETNFYAEDVVVKVSKDGAEAEAIVPVWEGNVGTIALEGDGDYVVYITYTDKANNQMVPYTSDMITIDKTAPVVKMEYIHKGDVQKTIFTVIEHNFRAEDIVVTGTVKDITNTDVDFTAAQITAMLQNAEWTKNGDEYTYEFDQYVNGYYNLTVDYKDICGWEAESYKAEEFLVDHSAPTGVTIEYSKPVFETVLEVITLGFYNPSVTITFTAYDADAGVDSFTWGYTKDADAGNINHPAILTKTVIKKSDITQTGDKFTATVTLTATEFAQYRGCISVYATDAYGNSSETVTDSKKVIVVDNVSPTLSVAYNTADGTDADNKYYYNNSIEVDLIITEANFFAEDVVVTVTKDGKAFDFGTITWSERNIYDRTIGSFVLPAPADHSGDGEYVISVEYTDRSQNAMSKYVSDTHVIDTISPVIDVKYDDAKVTVKERILDTNGKYRNYYADTKTATVTITEHNFNAGNVVWDITAKDVSGNVLNANELLTKSEWTSVGDVHTLTITYTGDANYTFDVSCTDKATNAATDYSTDYFTVDKTAPANLKVEYSTSVLDTILESVTFGFYNSKMTVTLTAEDSTTEIHSFVYSYLTTEGVSNINAGVIKAAIGSENIKYSDDRKTATATFEIPKLILVNDNQFNGTVEFTAADRAGNVSDTHKETKRIVVDNIAPTAKVSYNEATNVVGDISYYNGNIDVTVTINEANFYAGDVKIAVSKNGAAATFVTPQWTEASPDIHVAAFTLTEDGDYVITINYTDKSSNKMATYTSKQMTIDTKIEAPAYTINDKAKTEFGGAYKGDAKIGFSFADQNIDTNTITLTRTRFDKVEDVTETFVKVEKNNKGGSGSFTIPTEVGNDGIYVLKITMTDKAKHETTSEIKFSINRYGSVYEYSESLVELIKNGGQYVSKVEKDLIITEYNADRILEGSLQILITRDSENVDVKFESTPETINDQVVIGESGWYQYVYTIKSSNFEKDGVYKISLASKYAAEDSAENDSTSVPENSIDAEGNKILDTMNFTVDSVAPEIRNIINLEKKVINAQEVEVKYTIVDIGGIKTVEIILNGEVIDTINEFDGNNFNYSGQFKINESPDAQTVRFKVTDFAGNVVDTDSDDFSTGDKYVFNDEVTVSTNFFVRWYANKILFWGSIAGLIVLAAIVCVIVSVKKGKKEANK